MADARNSSIQTRWPPSGRPYDRGDSIDLGLEPPIEAAGDAASAIDHRRVSLRWLTGTVLTGLAGAGLIGSAIYAALNYSSRLAEAPEFVARERPSASDGTVNQSNKGDRLARPVDIIAARQSFRAPTTVKVGDREILRNRSFVHIGTTLAMNSLGLASDVPAFNPLKLLGGDPAPGEGGQDAEPDRQDADVSFLTQAMSDKDAASARFALTLDEIQAQVAEHLKGVSSGGQPNLPMPPQMMLMRTSRAGLAPGPLGYATLNNLGASDISAPFSSIEVKMVAENVTTVAKYSPAEGDADSAEKVVVVKRNETLEQFLAAEGATAQQIKAIAAALSGRRGQSGVQEGQKLRLLKMDIDGSGKARIARLSIYTDETLEGTVAINDQGEYVLVARADTSPQRGKRPASSDDEEDDESPGAMRLYTSFYETALKQQVPKRLIDELIRIFANDVDFNRGVTGGDAFEAFFAESEERDQTPELLYASITARGETFKYYRFAYDKDGTIDYFDPAGRSNRKFLIRKPVASGEQRSGFGWRRHPILGYSRMHTGVDWAAKIGTPIVASGNGVVIKAKRESGYGNRVEIQHGNGYVSTYNHMSAYGRGITEGARVRQGQLIGYVGNTGLSTGPHLHYEVIVNGNYVDPLRIRLARTRELTRQQLSDFARERERIEAVMAKAPNAARLASREATR